MDRIVYLIVLTVLTSIVLDLSEVTAQTTNARQLQSGNGQTLPDVQSQAAAGEDDDEDDIPSTRTFGPQRNSLFDSIFKVGARHRPAIGDLANIYYLVRRDRAF